ncbi:hypothetical protein Klosneuvirus_1_338 [Klosneuvirus KNV1]|uniref:C2H2-type domain-containing protein n=1 Tax=Klosneuvirus KNV1 TaxID=1977640 RepID=A0A1V0SIJ1_9VIRU|nr:hypothetical protein Klosneuvirus_1_338 [Klosneuvirus KNV1]
MSEYNCIPCNYQTKDRSNYAKHLKSNKHQKNITTSSSTFMSGKYQTNGQINNEKLPDYRCPYCHLTFTRQSGLTYHKKICSDKQLETQRLETEKKFEIQQKENEKQIEIEKLKIELEISKKQINSLENFIKTIKPTQTNNMYNVSIKKLVQSDYSDAPPLTHLENYEVIHDKQFVNFVDEIINYNDQKILYKYIGDIIIKHYKKENPEDQSMWNTDGSRLNYIIKEAMVNNKSRWVDDINANRIKEAVIRPLLDYIKSQNIKEQKLIHKDIRKASADKCIELTIKTNSIATINYEINNGTLETDIVKYITPYFRHLSDDQKMIVNE